MTSPDIDLLVPKQKSVEDWLNEVSYGEDLSYVPSEFALEFINFIKLVNGVQGEEHKSPVMHYKMLDQVAGRKRNITNMASRGSAKTSIFGEYLFLYIAVHGSIPGFGKVPLAIYVSDSIENGVKNMRKNLEFRRENSEFLMQFIPKVRFTDIRWEFISANGNVFIVKGYGATTGVRGAKELGTRPTLAVLDDLVSDDDARSATVIASIEDTVYKAVNYALHPSNYKIIWSGTPFNASDPLYKAVESGAWWVNVYPICEKFPCTKEEFKGAWEDRFTYEYVKEQYDKALKLGKIDTFNQELMLRIMSDEDRLIDDNDISWYSGASLLRNRSLFNFYITTDFATSEKTSADFSVISVWALSHKGDWYWIDGVCKKQLMDANVNDLFRLAQMYNPLGVGIEVTGQQGGFLPWIKQEMLTRNVYFVISKNKGSNAEGIRPTTDKMSRFNVVVPMFKAGRIHFPEEKRDSAIMIEAMNEITLASVKGFKSKHDDFIDTISMLPLINTWKPSAQPYAGNNAHHDETNLFSELSDDDVSGMESYIV